MKQQNNQDFVDKYSISHNKFISPTNIRELQYTLNVDVLKYQTQFLNNNFKQVARNSNFDLDNINQMFIHFVKQEQIQPLVREFNGQMDKDAIDYETLKYRNPYSYDNKEINLLQMFKDMKKRVHHGNFNTSNKFTKQDFIEDQYPRGDFILYKDFTTAYYNPK